MRLLKIQCGLFNLFNLFNLFKLFSFGFINNQRAGRRGGYGEGDPRLHEVLTFLFARGFGVEVLEFVAGGGV
jgi:hypothetical protein